MNQTPLKVILIVVISEAILAGVGLIALCATMFLKAYTDPAVLTAIIAITSGLIGSLGTLLVNPRQPTNPNGQPPPVQIKQPPNQPIPVVEQPQTKTNP